MSIRRVLLAIVVVALGLGYFVLFVRDPLPARSTLAIDWERVRALAGPVGAGPREVRSEVVAHGRFFGWMVCAGCGWGEVPMEFRTYQLVYADGSSVVVDAVHDAERHAAMPMMADYDAEAFARQKTALRRADRILLTHEHWDHANGLLSVIDDAAVRPHLLIPQAQRHSAAMREAGLSEASFEGLPEAPDVALRPVAPGVVAIAMPGHTPGSQVVYVRRADGAEYLFVGDITWNARNLRERRGKSLLIGLVAGEDRARIADQIAYLADLASPAASSAPASASPRPSFAFVVAHDPAQNAALIEQGLLEPGLVLEAAYEVVPGWPALAPDVETGETSGVGVDSHGHVFLFHRGPGPSVLGLDPGDGRVVVRFGEGVFRNPHGLAVGPSDEIWVTDTLRHQVLRFSHDGELLATIGEEGVPGDDLAHFDQPTDLAFASTGEIYVSDGYGNSRVVRLSQEGRPVTSFGHKGRGPGEFDLPHGITIDAQDRIYVADRGNERVQVFDRDGHPLAAWGPEVFGRGTRAWGVEVAGDRLFVIDGGHMNPEIAGFARLTRMALDGRVEAQWSRYGTAPGELAWGHDLAVGPDGAVYTAEVRINDRIQKFVPTPSTAP
ncbi:MAG: MBL fold metallo-hydrolase [Myxococcota bacterium]